MASRTIEAFYLGVGLDLDLLEGNFLSETAFSLVGLTFGSAASPLVDTSLRQITLTDSNNDGIVRENDVFDNPFGEGLSYDGIFRVLDSTQEYATTITYTDGTTASGRIVLLQDTAGRVFIAPYVTGSTFNAVLGAGPIRSIRLDAVLGDTFGGVVLGLEVDAFVTCFLRGTRIALADGPRAIEDVRPGDRVLTADAGPQPVLHVTHSRCAGDGRHAPVRIER